MRTPIDHWLANVRRSLATLGYLATLSAAPIPQAAQVDLLEKYPTTLTVGDTDPTRARPWEFGEPDICRLTGFQFDVGTGFRVEVGPADLGIGHCADGAVWAVVIPRATGSLTSSAANQPESIAHVWLRFHPKIITRLFPTSTVTDDGDRSLAAQMSLIQGVKFRSSWHAGNNAMIPDPKDLTVDVDTVGGLRRFFAVDTAAATARYYSDFEARSVPAVPALTPELAAATFDQLWEAFDRDYAMFVLRPEVDWTALKDQCRPRALASATTYQFAGVCAEMLRPLRDLHVWLTVSGAYIPVYDRPRLSNSNPDAFNSLLGTVHKPSSSLQWAVTGDKIGFIAIHSWTDTQVPAQFDEALAAMRNTRGLIIDVRLNGGGSEPLAQQVAARFLAKTATYAFSQYRNGPEHSDLTDKMPRTVAPRGPFQYTLPVVLLIGQRCMSSNESFVSMMTCAAQVITMGDHTAGSSGNPKTVELPLSMVVSVPRWIDYLPDGTPLDEKGVAPQEPFTASAGAFEGDRDDLLRAALQRLRAVPLPDEPIAMQDLGLQGRWPGYRRGTAQGVTVSGNTAFVAAGGVHVMDVTDPAQPKRLGGYDMDSDAKDVAVSGHFAYAIDSSRLYVLDIADLSHPVRVGTVDIGGWGNAVAVSGDRAYVASLGLYVIDIANPAQPRLLGRYNTSSVARDVAVSGQHAFLALGESGLHVIDVSDPTQPLLAGRFSPSGRVEVVAVSGNRAYIGGYEIGLQAVDMTNPAQPRVLGHFDITWPPADVAVSGSWAYVVNSVNGLMVFDISDPAALKRSAVYALKSSARGGVAVAGHYAYIADGAAGLQIIDVSTPANPQSAGKFDTSCWPVSAASVGRFVCLAEGFGGLQIIDVQDRSHPNRVGTYAANGTIQGVATFNHYAIAVGSTGLEVIDLSDPAAPRRISQVPSVGNVQDIALSGDYAYVLAWPQDLVVVDVGDPARPRLVGRCDYGAVGMKLALSGSLAFVAAGFDGIAIIDIADPAHPRSIGKFKTATLAEGVAAQGNFVYVAGQSGLAVLDVTDPRRPQPAGSFRSMWGFQNVALAGNIAYVVGVKGLIVLDITHPARLRKLDDSSELDRGEGLLLNGDTLYVLAEEDGLMVFDSYKSPVRFEGGLSTDLAGFHLLFRGEADQPVLLQRSRDLETWEDWVTLRGTGGRQEVVDPSAGSASSLFYRLAPAVSPKPKFSILWCSSWGSWESINMVGIYGYSQAAAMAEELGAVNEEVQEDTILTTNKLASYDAVIFMNMEASRTLSQTEKSAVRDFLMAGRSILVIGQQDPGASLSREAAFANSVTVPYGIEFTTGAAPDATILVAHPITQGLAMVPGGGSGLRVTSPAEALAPKSAPSAVLAISSAGPGRVVAISDDSAFADSFLETSASNRRYVSNLLKWLLRLE